jgi:predicted membrane protein
MVSSRIRPNVVIMVPPAHWASGLLLTKMKEQKMPLLNLVVVLVVVGVALYLINRYIPMASSIKSILNVVVVVVVCIWVLQAVGLWGSISSFRLPR